MGADRRNCLSADERPVLDSLRLQVCAERETVAPPWGWRMSRRRSLRKAELREGAVCRVELRPDGFRRSGRQRAMSLEPWVLGQVVLVGGGRSVAVIVCHTPRSGSVGSVVLRLGRAWAQTNQGVARLRPSGRRDLSPQISGRW